MLVWTNMIYAAFNFFAFHCCLQFWAARTVFWKYLDKGEPGTACICRNALLRVARYPSVGESCWFFLACAGMLVCNGDMTALTTCSLILTAKSGALLTKSAVDLAQATLPWCRFGRVSREWPFVPFVLFLGEDRRANCRDRLLSSVGVSCQGHMSKSALSWLA